VLHTNIKVAVGAACLVAAVLAGASVAVSHGGATGVVKERMVAMKDMGGRMKALAAMVRGRTPFDAAAAKEAADAIAAHARDVPRLFPKGSRHGPSEAVEKIWIEWPQFVTEAKTLANRADAFGRQAVSATTGTDLGRAFGDIGRSCKSCHKKYREKK
jgi:cytochrome c556